MVRGVAARAFQIPNPESPIPAPSKLRAAGRARVGDRVADVGQPAHVHHQPLEAQAEARVRHAAVAAEVAVPVIVLAVEAELVHAFARHAKPLPAVRTAAELARKSGV